MNTLAIIALFIHFAMLLVGVFRLWRAKSLPDQLVAAELTSTLSIALLILLSILWKESMIIDLAVVLAFVAAAAPISFSIYIANKKNPTHGRNH